MLIMSMFVDIAVVEEQLLFHTWDFHLLTKLGHHNLYLEIDKFPMKGAELVQLVLISIKQAYKLL